MFGFFILLLGFAYTDVCDVGCEGKLGNGFCDLECMVKECEFAEF